MKKISLILQCKPCRSPPQVAVVADSPPRVNGAATLHLMLVANDQLGGTLPESNEVDYELPLQWAEP